MPNEIFSGNYSKALNQRTYDGLSADMKAQVDADPDKQFQLEMMDLQHKQAIQATLMQTLAAMQKKDDDTTAAIAQMFR